MNGGMSAIGPKQNVCFRGQSGHDHLRVLDLLGWRRKRKAQATN